MPRPEGIATLSLPLLLLSAGWAGTNAPTRGDCDVMEPSSPVVSTVAGTNAPTRGDCDLCFAVLISSVVMAGTNAPTRGDCDLDIVE